MNADFWAVITVGIAILIAIAASNRSLRREMNERIDAVQRELGERIDAVQRELGERIDRLSERVDRLSARVDRLSERVDRLSARVGDMRERLGRVEGLLEGFGLSRRKRAGQGRDDEKHGPSLPRS